VADQEDKEKTKGAEPQAQPGKGGKLVPGLITAVLVVVLAGAGFIVGRLFGTRGQTQTAGAAQPADSSTTPALQTPALQPETGKTWYYELDSVIANLNEPGVTRYVRVGLTLEISDAMSEKDGVLFLDQKKPVMKHWLTLYLSNQTIEDMRGEKNLTRMQTQISSLFNDGLFPGAPPRIVRVLFKEFSIQ
jgi:flagellar basal body-associated protein FliL